MGFDVKRAESIASGFKEWIHKGLITYDNAVKQIKETYREDMAREIIRILEHDIKETKEKCRWALVFSDVEEAEKARERLSWRNIYPDSQEENKLLWIDKDEAEYAREHVGGLIEPWGKPTLIPEKAKEEIAEAVERWKAPERKITSYSITVFLKDGKVTGTPWFDKEEQARSYMKRKLTEMGYTETDIERIQLYPWRESDTLETVERRIIERL